MPAKNFFDTNVLLYLLQQDQIKTQRAMTLLRAGGSISVQVLNEFTHNARRKFKLDWTVVDEFTLAFLSSLEVVPLTAATYRQGRYLAERYQLQLYDAMILAAALEAGATTLYSEDMHDGLLVEGQLKIRNPFAG
ncbi:MAG: PIN domain-containing protein [Comamonas sp.]|nr:PIN domain-containing protein [Comamonas sp.]